ncbi:hypothetical protein HK405_008735 [Cladochytrium tenue]|nr:hypothetical protein HK405_008735 [Cladochytrium tenue]
MTKQSDDHQAALRLPIRVEQRGNRGTLRFASPLDGVAGGSGGGGPLWLGVEWDDPARGKHSGQHPRRPEEPPLFHVVVPGSASFVKVTPLTAGPRLQRALHLSGFPAVGAGSAATDRFRFARTFLSALRERYAGALGGTSELQRPLDQPDDDNATVGLADVAFGSKTVETVGWLKVARKLGRLQVLQEVSVAGMRVGWVGGQLLDDGDGGSDDGGSEDAAARDESDGVISETCPAVMDLNLAQCLFVSWEEVARVTRQLPLLKTLRLNKNRLLSVGDVSVVSVAFRSLTTLALNETVASWEDIAGLAQHFPVLEQLHLGANRIAHLDATDAPEPCFPHLRVLNLEDNNIASWGCVAELTKRSLPNLEALHLNGNAIATIEIPTPSDGTPFKSLSYLNLSRNRVSTWSSVHALNDLPALRELRFKDNPITDGSGVAFGEPAPPQSAAPHSGLGTTDLLIARVDRVTMLNGSSVTPRVRLDAELYYLNWVVRRYPGVLQLTQQQRQSLSPLTPAIQAELTSVHTDHPRFFELAERHSTAAAAAVAAVATASGSAPMLKDRLLELTLVLVANADESDSDTWDQRSRVPVGLRRRAVRRRLPATMAVRAARGLAARVLGVPAGRGVRLFAVRGGGLDAASGNEEAVAEEAADDLRELGFYGLASGDELVVIA